RRRVRPLRDRSDRAVVPASFVHAGDPADLLGAGTGRGRDRRPRLGRIGFKTLLYILLVTTIAVTIGVVMVNVFQPGAGMSREVGEALMARESHASAAIMTSRESLSGIDILLNIVPRNPVQAAANGDLIAVMFFALMFGVAATVMRTPGVNAFVGTVQGIYEISLK